MIRNSNMIAGIVLSSMVHAAVFMQWQTDFSFEKSTAPVEALDSQISVQLVKYIKPVTQAINKVIKKESIVKPADVKPEVVKSDLSDKKSIAEPVKEIVEQKVEELEVVEDVPDDKMDEKNNELMARNQAAEKAEVLNQQLKTDLEAERKNYLKRLLAHIETYKFYPAAARRRLIEGKLDVAFFLREDGGHYELTIDGGKAVLQRAVRQALEDAQPFPKPPASLPINQRIAFSMYYELK